MGLAVSMYLRMTGNFELPDTATAMACFDVFQEQLRRIGVARDVVKECANNNNNATMNAAMFTRSSKLCKGILTLSDFRRIVGPSAVDSACKQIPDHGQCILCMSAMYSLIQQLDTTAKKNGDGDGGDVGECFDFVIIYAAGVVNDAGPWDEETAKCILAVQYDAPAVGASARTGMLVGLGAATAAAILASAALVFLAAKRRRQGAVHRDFVSRNNKLLQGTAANGGGGSGSGTTAATAAVLLWYDWHELKAATRGFSDQNLVGEGAFGSVYRGVLKDGQTIAVKCFRNCTPDGDDSFLNEVDVISKVKHRNLVVLRGFCVASTKSDGHQRMLVYDFMPHGSLADCLFGKESKEKQQEEEEEIERSTNNNSNKPLSTRPCSTTKPYCSTKPSVGSTAVVAASLQAGVRGSVLLEWKDRYKIAVGMAKGLAYLHSEVVPQIIHRDIKANNILLDKNFNARVADFGLAKLAPEDETHFTTHVAGTHGYVAPEYALYGQLTDKSDVYSFGVCLLELLSSRTALMYTTTTPTTTTPTTTTTAPTSGGRSSSPVLCLVTDWAWLLVKEGKGIEVVDPAIRDSDDGAHQDVMLRFVKVGILCAHLLVAFRPSMMKALKMLEGDCDVPDIPDRPLPLTFDLLYNNNNNNNNNQQHSIHAENNSCVSSSHSTTPFLDVALDQEELLR